MAPTTRQSTKNTENFQSINNNDYVDRKRRSKMSKNHMVNMQRTIYHHLYIKNVSPTGSLNSSRNPRRMTDTRREKILAFVKMARENPAAYKPFKSDGWIRELISSMKERTNQRPSINDVRAWITLYPNLFVADDDNDNDEISDNPHSMSSATTSPPSSSSSSSSLSIFGSLNIEDDDETYSSSPPPLGLFTPEVLNSIKVELIPETNQIEDEVDAVPEPTMEMEASGSNQFLPLQNVFLPEDHAPRIEPNVDVQQQPRRSLRKLKQQQTPPQPSTSTSATAAVVAAISPAKPAWSFDEETSIGFCKATYGDGTTTRLNYRVISEDDAQKILRALNITETAQGMKMLEL